jgi:ubiquinol-cytochrome c reductase iron-sulfur subunit
MSPLRTAARWLGAMLLLAAGRRRAERQAERVVPPPDPARRATAVVMALLAGASLSAVGFIVAYLLGGDTQLLGLGLGLAFAFLAAATLVASRRLIPQEVRSEELGSRDDPAAREQAAQILREGGEGLSRRGLMLAAGGTAGVCGAALLLPAASLGPVLETERLDETAWQPGRRLVDERGRAILADDLAVGSFVTAFAEGIERKRLDASLVVVRVRPDELQLPPERAGWAVDGILAYSKSCTHAGCAVSMFDYPLYRPTSPRPRLVCPCHYSAFDVGDAGKVLFGPAGRPLPQLPLLRAADGSLVAGGPLSAPPGPSWSGVRT